MKNKPLEMSEKEYDEQQADLENKLIGKVDNIMFKILIIIICTWYKKKK